VAGVYTLSEESKAFLISQKNYKSVPPSSVTLTSDGSVTIESLPDAYVDGFGRGNGRFLRGQGKWELKTTDFGYGITLTIAGGGTLPPAIYHGSSILLRGRQAPYRIAFQLGDPDSRESISYEKHGG
jgi:hypothetical protein